MVNTLSFILGISAMIIMCAAWVYCGLFVKYYRQNHKKLMPLVAGAAFVMGCFYSGPVVTFLNLLLNGTNISPSLYHYLSYTLTPIASCLMVLLGLNVFWPKAQKMVIFFYVIIGIVYWILIFFFHDQQFEVISGDPEILDISHAGPSRIITAVFIILVCLLDSVGFFLFYGKLRKFDASAKELKKTLMIAIGWFLFGISGILDAILTIDSPFIMATIRCLMILAYILIFQGFTAPKSEK